MKNIQSWVETTLPPGYGPLVHGTLVGWVSGTHSGGFGPSECQRNRAAWRHWTTTILRAYGPIQWKHEWNGVWRRPIASVQGVTIDAFSAIREASRYYVIFIEQTDADTRSKDIDEAMARFAGALIAFGERKREGTP